MNFRQDPLSNGWNHSSAYQRPSIFGALPYPDRTPSVVDASRFYFVFRPDILNSEVFGPQSRRAMFRIETDRSMRHTLLKTELGDIAFVDWRGKRPCVEMRGFLSMREARDWLRLSLTGNCRAMEFNGIHYSWTPKDGCIYLLYAAHPSSSYLAKISRIDDTVCLDVTDVGLGLGLLDTCVLATVILQCGMNID